VIARRSQHNPQHGHAQWMQDGEKEMRYGRVSITGGALKGRGVAVLREGVARYTSSKVREALFDILGDMEGRRVLDLFAGSGSFIIEALSRGALSGTSVEKDRDMARLLKSNLKELSLSDHCQVLVMDVMQAVPFLYRNAASYDIIFMDPPYERGYILATMSLLETHIVYDKDTVFVLEHSKRETLEASVLNAWKQLKTRTYGDTVVTLLKAHQPTT